MAVTGLDNPDDLFSYADSLADRLRRDPMIAQATLSGFSEPEITIEISALTLKQYGVTISDVADALARNSIDLPAGVMESMQMPRERSSSGNDQR